MDKAHSGAHLFLKVSNVLRVLALCLRALGSEPALIGPWRCRDYWNSLILRKLWVVKQQVRLGSLLVELVRTAEGLRLFSSDLRVGDALLGHPRLHGASVNLSAEMLDVLSKEIQFLVDDILLFVTDLDKSTERVKLVLPLAFPPCVRLTT